MHTTKNASLRQLEYDMEQCKANNDRTGAVRLARQIMALSPRNRNVWENITAVFIDGKKPEEAVSALAFLEAHFKPQGYWQVLRASIAYMQGDYQTVLDCGEQALQDDSLQSWQKALLYNILAKVEVELGRADKAAIYELAASKLPNNPGALLEYSNMLFLLHYLEVPQTEMYKALYGYDKLLSGIKPYIHRIPYNHGKIRVGYVSADFCYSVVFLFTFVFFAAYDKFRFEVYAYAKGEEDDASRMIAAKADVWRNISKLSPAEAAAVIRNDEIDILFDPSGHNADNCLEIMAYKPAPVQISGIGWFDSTGMDAINYFLTDVYVDPPGSNDEYFTEKLLRLPHSHFCYYLTTDHKQKLSAPFLINGYITFGTLNKFAKITDKMLGAWAKILHQVPHSRLFLKGKTFDTSLGREIAKQRLRAAGIDENRVVLEGFSKDYMSAYGKIDIALDTFPYPGGTTTCDALFAGVPVVTLVGHTHNSRFGYSLLKNLELEELCAQTLSEYITICTELASNCKRLLDYRLNLPRRFRQSPLMDEGGYMTELELLYEALVPRKNKAHLSMDNLAQCEEKGDWDRIILAANARLAVHDYKHKEEVLLWGWLGEAYLGSTKNTSLSRAKYCLQKALSKARGKQRLIFLCYLCETAEKLGDFVLQYQAANEAVSMLEQYGHTLPRWWISNLHVICAHSAMMLGKFAECEQEYLQGAQNKENLQEQLDIMTSYVLASHYQPYSSAEIWQRQQRYAKLIEQIKPLPPLPAEHKYGQKIRIGYISPNFHRHAMYPIYYGFFAHHDGDNFSVIGYQLNSYTDSYTQRIRDLADEWRDVSAMSHEDIAKLVRADKIDILVDLASHLANTGLPVLAYRPARVHISGLGSICTSGISAVDYYITDKVVDPPGLHDDYFVEKPLYMPAQFAYAGLEQAPKPQGAPCLRQGYIQFGVFQLFTKVTDEMLLVWKEIMDKLPTSRLLLKGASFDNDALAEFIYNRLKKLDMPMDRIDLEGYSPYEEYLQRLQDVDIMLDTYPYTGGSTTLDALYMGVPTVTLYGERRGTRFGYSILKSVGLEELASPDKSNYIQRAIALAEDQELLDTLHKCLRGRLNESKALSPYHYVKKMENYYRQMIYPREILQSLISQAYQALKHGDYVRAEQAYFTAGQIGDTLWLRSEAISSYLLTSQYSDYETAEICRRQELYAKQLEQIEPLPITGTRKRRENKLRIGYLSPDFRNHAMFPIYYGLFACHDREHFHVMGYQMNARSDAFTLEVKRLASDWRMVAGLSVEDIARLIRNDEIDILVDLAGHSMNSGLPVLAYRPASVQISGLGSLCTTGLNAVDYFITDEICDPPGLHDEYYKEKLLYMPCQFSYAGRNDVPTSSTSPFHKNGFVQLGCFQEYTKINDETLAVWREILYLLPEVKLLFKSIPFELADIKKAAYERMSGAGIPMERVILEAGDENYMQRMLDVDLMLDTYPYTGGRTTLDALYMGVPVVTRYGERRNTRFGYSILHSLGLDELAVSDRKSYVERVVSLAGNGELLDILHKNLRQMMNNSTALSPRKYTQALEAHYLRLAKIQ